MVGLDASCHTILPSVVVLIILHCICLFYISATQLNCTLHEKWGSCFVHHDNTYSRLSQHIEKLNVMENYLFFQHQIDKFMTQSKCLIESMQEYLNLVTKKKWDNPCSVERQTDRDKRLRGRNHWGFAFVLKRGNNSSALLENHPCYVIIIYMAISLTFVEKMNVSCQET